MITLKYKPKIILSSRLSVSLRSVKPFKFAANHW